MRRAIDQPAPAQIRERAVRINSVDSGLALADLTEVVRPLFRPLTLNAWVEFGADVDSYNRQI